MSKAEIPEGKTTLALSDETHAKLVQMKEQGHFAEMIDAYRLGIAIAMQQGLLDPKASKRSKTTFNIGTLDTDGMIRDVVSQTYPLGEGEPVEIIQRLGEAGVKVIWDALEREGGLGRLLAEPTTAET